MIKSVTVTNHLGDSLKLEMRRPETSGFYIKKIDGLGPSKANINVTERATIDGGQYSSSHVNSRNIIISLGFVFSHGVESVRHKSYKYFPLKKRIRLVIETDMRICETYGYVESNEPDIFSPDESTQISIICPDPHFYSAGADATNATTFSSKEVLFEFPFSNEMTGKVYLLENVTIDEVRSNNEFAPEPNTTYYATIDGSMDSELIELEATSDNNGRIEFSGSTTVDGIADWAKLIYDNGWYIDMMASMFSEGTVCVYTKGVLAEAYNIEFATIETSTIKSVVYKGEVEVGVNIFIHAVGAASNVAIYNDTTRESMKIDTTKLRALTGNGIISGDDIVICTTKGQKSVTLFRNGNEINILNCLDKQSDWFQLSSGDNVFMYTADSGAENLLFRIEARTAYEGV